MMTALAVGLFVLAHVWAAWRWLASDRAEWRAMQRGGYAELRRHQIEHGEQGIDP